MNAIDIILVLLIGLSVVAGFMSGFSRLIIGLAATIVGIFLGFWFYGLVGDALLPYVHRPEIANAIGFLVVLGVCLAVGALLGKALAALFKWTGLTWLDRFLGGLAGFVRGAIIAVALMTVVLAFAPNPPPRMLIDSRSLPYVMRSATLLAEVTPRELKDAITATQSKVHDMWDTAKPHKLADGDEKQ